MSQRGLNQSYRTIHKFFSTLSKSHSFSHDSARSTSTTTTTTTRTFLSSRSTLKPLNYPPTSLQCRPRRLVHTHTDPKCPAPDCPHRPSASTSAAGQGGSSTALDTIKAHPITLSHPPNYLSSLPLRLRRLASALPQSSPPSRDQLLSLTSSFFQRLRIRFKWATIRSFRRFRADDYSAFFSVGVITTLGWVLISTTSFCTFVFFLINSIKGQEYMARKLGDYLTQSTGVSVVFESAIVPKWGLVGGKSKIVFKNVYISRGPPKPELGVLLPEELEVDTAKETEEERKAREQRAKWTHFHLSIDTVEVSLSLARWLDGNGLVKDAAVTGVRGVVDRSHVVWDPDAPRDRTAYRHHSAPGDFWLEGLLIEDFLVTIYQPDHFRPYTFSIFNADIRKLRKQWLFYDLMSAESITGQVDDCLFSLHKPQSIGRTSVEDLKDASWARMSRFRIDAVPIDHMQSAHDTGVLSWVTSGRCDIVADIRFPRDPSDEDDVDLAALVADLVGEIGALMDGSSVDAEKKFKERNEKGDRIPGRRVLSKEPLGVPVGWKKEDVGEEEEDDMEWRRIVRKMIKRVRGQDKEDGVEEVDEEWTMGLGVRERKGMKARELEKIVGKVKDRVVSIDLDIRFKDLKAHVPFFTTNLSYINNALIRPIVAFINANRTLVPIRAHLDLPLYEFDGSWTTYDVGILEQISEQTYAALAHHVTNAQNQRLQAVSLWTLQLTANAVLNAFRNQLAPY